MYIYAYISQNTSYRYQTDYKRTDQTNEKINNLNNLTELLKTNANN